MINTLKNENDLLKERLKCITGEIASFQSDICIESSEISILMKTFIKDIGDTKWCTKMKQNTIIKIFDEKDNVIPVVLDINYTNVLINKIKLSNFISLILTKCDLDNIRYLDIGDGKDKTLFSNLLLLDKLYDIMKTDIIYKKNTEALNLLKFTETVIPPAYMKISKRFPHLSLEQIIEFYKKVCKNGGKLKVHSGQFVLTDRTESNVYGLSSVDTGSYQQMSWNCCPRVMRDRSNKHVLGFCRKNRSSDISKGITISQSKQMISNRKYMYSHGRCIFNGDINSACMDGNREPDPSSECFLSEWFYLDDTPDDKFREEIRTQKISDIEINIDKHIDALNKSNSIKSKKISELYELKKHLKYVI
jgi:hypothetical protein